MLNRLLLTLSSTALLTLSAASLSYKISLLDDSVVSGKQVKAGDYKLELKDSNTAVLMHGKKSIEVPARAETSPTKFANTEIEYSNNRDVREVRIGGTNTTIVFGGTNATTNGTN
jgi:hypothetical protein